MRFASKLGIVAVALVALTVSATSAAAPAPRSAALTEFDGRVVSVNKKAKRFRVRDLERGTKRIHVRRSTRFERINGMAGIRRGLLVEVVAKRANGRWIAVEVERKRPNDDDRRGDDD